MADTIACTWCGAENPKPAPASCVACKLNPMPGEDPTKGGKVDPKVARATKRSRRAQPIGRALSTTPAGKPVLGIDPGSRYTAVVVRDGDVVLHATTLVRPEKMNSTDWALEVLVGVKVILAEFPKVPLAVEGINPPTGFHRGQKATLNPRDILRAGIVLGAIVATWPDITIIPPGGNGSNHYSHYPACLIGRRPADLPGSTNSAGTRDHEQSAYDVAGKAVATAYPRMRTPLLASAPPARARQKPAAN